MNNTSYSLSIEELAYAMGFLGGAETAAGFLQTLAGQLNDANLDGRITAASHSLLARGYLQFDLSSKAKALQAELSQAVTAMLTPRYSFRCDKTNPHNAEVEATQTSYFLGDACVVKHEVELGVVSRLALYPNSDDLVPLLMTFIGQAWGDRPFISPDEKPAAAGKLEDTLIQQLRNFAKTPTRDPGALALQLQAHLPFAVANQLAHDVDAETVQWGSIFRLEMHPGQMDINQGIIFARQPARTWLFEISAATQAQWLVYNASSEVMAAVLAQFVR